MADDLPILIGIIVALVIICGFVSRAREKRKRKDTSDHPYPWGDEGSHGGDEGIGDTDDDGTHDDGD